MPIGETIQIESFLLEESFNNEKLIEWSAKNLLDAQESAIQVILTENETRNADVELFLLKLKIRMGMASNKTAKTIKEYRAVVNEEAKKLAGTYRDLFKRHERVSLSILRTVVNGSIVSAGVIINGGVAPTTGLAIGFFSGALSGFFQYNNAFFQSFVDGNFERNRKTIETKKFGNTRVKTVQLTRWFFTEVSLFGLINTFNYAMGVPMGGFVSETINVFKSSLYGTASQGIWDSTIASETREQLRNAEGNSSAQARIQMKSNIKTFTVSMASMFGGVLTLMGSSVGTYSLGALGAAGVIYTYFSHKNKAPQQEKPANINLILTNCRMIFSL